MSSDFKIDIPFDTKPPRLKELVNKGIYNCRQAQGFNG